MKAEEFAVGLRVYWRRQATGTVVGQDNLLSYNWYVDWDNHTSSRLHCAFLNPIPPLEQLAECAE